MRKICLIFIGIILFLAMSVSVLLSHISSTVSDKNLFSNTLEKANFYDYFYDSLITLLVEDIVENGYEINGTNQNSKLVKFYDNESAKKSINLYIKTLISKEYFKEKTKLTINQILMLVNNENHDLSIDYDFDIVMKDSITDFRTLSKDLKFAQLIKDILSVESVEILQPLTEDLGFEYTEIEIKTALDDIFPDEWIENNLFIIHDSVIYFIAKDTDSFLVTIPIDDRLELAADVIKNKLNEDDILYDLVLKKLLNPLLENNLSNITNFGYGITVTQEEVLSIFKTLAPKDWVGMHGNNIIDSSVSYLISEKDDLSYSIDLSDRKIAAAIELRKFGKNKLDTLLSELPACQNFIQSSLATSSIAKKNKPSCIPGGQLAINIFYDDMIKIINDEIDKFISDQFPSKLDLTSQDVEGLIGDNSEFIKLRKNISDGYSLTNDDLISLISSEERSVDIEDIRSLLSGNINNKNLETIIGLEIREIDEIRSYINQIKLMKTVMFAIIFMLVMLFAFVSIKSANKSLRFLVSIRNTSFIFLISSLSIGLIIQSVKLIDITPYLENISLPDIENTFPNLSKELNSNNFILQIVDIKDAWINEMFISTLIYILPSMIFFILSFVYIKNKEKNKKGES
ncbi:MAG: hypothetical protein CL774_03695 [Chloroflexi bacterium]|nr:hypothetical protein [Chloroflexota bacterium]